MTLDDVARFLGAEFRKPRTFRGDFAKVIFAQTEGSPLFMADLLRYLVERGTLVQTENRWRVMGELPDLSCELPESVRGTIRRKLDRLDAWIGDCWRPRRSKDASSIR